MTARKRAIAAGIADLPAIGVDGKRYPGCERDAPVVYGAGSRGPRGPYDGPETRNSRRDRRSAGDRC